MKRYGLLAMPCVLATLIISGCAVEGGEEDSVTDEGRSAIISLNALIPLGLSPAGTYPSALTPAMLAPKALSFASLAAAARGAIEDPGASGALSRRLLAYTVGCALNGNQSFTFSWIDAQGATHEESYPGQLGLATEWATGALDASPQQWVSACLIARVNYVGAVVSVSARGDHERLEETSSGEQSTYTFEEGAFWGNLFTANPTAYACEISNNRDRSRGAQRNCAAGYPDPKTGNILSCGVVQRLGSCDTRCDPLTKKGGHHATCAAPGGSSVSQVVTIYLQ